MTAKSAMPMKPGVADFRLFYLSSLSRFVNKIFFVFCHKSLEIIIFATELIFVLYDVFCKVIQYCRNLVYVIRGRPCAKWHGGWRR